MIVALAALAALSGCAIADPVDAPPKAEFTYRVGPLDLLLVEVFDEPGLQRELAVTPDGHITFPLVGQVAVARRTIPEIARAIADALIKSDRFIDAKLVNVNVTLRESRSSQVQVIGEVGRQGPVPYRDGLSALEAIGLAGGPTWGFAKTETVHVVRGSLDNPVVFEMDLDYVLVAEEKDIFLRPGDIVVVPAKWVTRMDRYVRQLFSPITSLVGATRQAGGAALP